MAANPRPYLPLRGVRVLCFEIAYSLPAGTRTLAELGAEVVRISPPARSAGANYISIVDGVFLSKQCVGLDLRNSAGLELAKRLITKADVVVSNFTSHVMPSFGLGPDDLLAIKPDLIVLQLTGYGMPGPWSDYPAYGPSVEAAGGMNRISGREDDPPLRVGSGVFADQLSGRYAALALTAAIRERGRTGKGRYIDVSMYESIVNLLGYFTLDAARTGKAMPPRRGNRDASMAPQGIYPCAGNDEWVAISVRSDAAWQAFAGVLDCAELRKPEFETLASRQANHDEIDAVIAGWTLGREKLVVAERLQAAGIAAGPVQKVSDIPLDPHLAARGFFQTIEHEQPMFDYMAHPHPTTPWQAEGGARARLRDFRFPGADNAAVLESWLGLTSDEIAAAEKSGGTFASQPQAAGERGPAIGAATDTDFAERLGLPPAPQGDAAAEAAK